MESDEIVNSAIASFQVSKKNYLDATAKKVAPPPPERAFDSIFVLKKKAIFEAESGLNNLQNEIQVGMQIVMDVMEREDPTHFHEMMTWLSENEEMIASTMQAAATKQSPVNEMPFPPAILSAIYAIVKTLMANQKFEQAAHAIHVCLSADANILSYWITYSSILQSMHDDVSALYALQVALTLDDNNPYTHAYIAKSWIALSQPQEAQKSLQTALQLCTNSHFQNLIDYCLALNAYCDKQAA